MGESFLIRVKGLSLAFGERVIFKDTDLTFGDRCRVGLVGDNGAGKTTFLRLLAGEIEPDAGEIEFVGSSLDVGYLAQDLAELGDGTVIDLLRERAGIARIEEELSRAEARVAELPQSSPELRRALDEHERLQSAFISRGGYEFSATSRKVLRGLGFADGDADRPCGEFSGGWRMRIALAAVLMRHPDIMLLDEPTNHLDSESMEWLEGWLRDFSGSLIFVSHDRRFLDKMATEIAETARGTITRYAMGYEEYLVEREAARARREKAYIEQREEIEKMEKFIDRFRYKATKAAQVQSRIRRLEKMDILAPEERAKTVAIRFPEAPRSGRSVLRGEGLSKSYGAHRVFANVDVEIERGERVALVGVNGAGKSTLMRVLAGIEPGDAGKTEIGHGVTMAFYSQERAQDLNYAHTVWEEACRTGSDMLEADRRTLLGAFLFSGSDVEKPVRVLSGGEKSRLALFKLLLSDTNFLMLDEPTNHLDMNTREVFQRALLDYGGTLLIVSHDRYFLDSLVNRVIEIRDGSLRSYPGTYSEFIDRRASQEASREIAAANAPRSPKAPEAQSADADSKKRDKRAEAEERNKIYRVRKKFMDRIEPLEHRIEMDETRTREIDALLCDPDVLADSSAVKDLMIERKKIEDALASSYSEWEALNAEMEAAAAEAAAK